MTKLTFYELDKNKQDLSAFYINVKKYFTNVNKTKKNSSTFKSLDSIVQSSVERGEILICNGEDIFEQDTFFEVIYNVDDYFVHFDIDVYYENYFKAKFNLEEIKDVEKTKKLHGLYEVRKGY